MNSNSPPDHSDPTNDITIMLSRADFDALMEGKEIRRQQGSERGVRLILRDVDEHTMDGPVQLPEWRREGDQFRKRWKEIFPDADEQELIILDNCAGLRLLKEDSEEVTFWTDGPAIGFDKRTSIEVIVKLPDPLASAIVWQQRDDKIQVWKDHGNGSGGGRECAEEFTDADELAEWFRAQIEST